MLIVLFAGAFSSLSAQDKLLPGASLGVYLADITDAKAQDLKLGDIRGAIVGKVLENSPAAKAGIKENDIIIGFDNQAIQKASQVFMLLNETLPGSSVLLRVARNLEEQEITVIVAERQTTTSDSGSSSGQYYSTPRRLRIGLKVAPLSDQLAAYLGASGKIGILVTEVENRSVAEKAEIRAGDCLLRVAGTPVGTAADLNNFINDIISRKQTAQAKGEDGELSFEVVRGGKEKKLTIKLSEVDS